MEAEELSHLSGATHPPPLAPPALVSLAPFYILSPPPPRRLSSHFCPPSKPLLASPPPATTAWVSLQGRLVGAAAASSARAIGGNLSKQEAVAWELFSPIHRVLIVAVVAAAAADSKKFRQILQLRRSVELRDQVLLTMQQKLDDLCEKMNSMQDRHGNRRMLGESDESTVDEKHCGGEFCDSRNRIFQSNPENFVVVSHPTPLNDSKRGNLEKETGEEMFKMHNFDGAEQEERRMSDLSDWCSSVTSSGEIQLNTLAVGQEIYNLQKQCEEKDATIKELAFLSRESEIAGSKRIAELEDIIKRKNMVITKLKKDMLILEQKILHLTRLRRPSFSASNSNNLLIPVMANNLLYDMDSSTSPSSSDSDCPLELEESRTEGLTDLKDRNSTRDDESSAREGDNHSSFSLSPKLRKSQKQSSSKASVGLPRLISECSKQRSVSPLKENVVNYCLDSNALLRSKQLASKKNYRRLDQPASQKRWV